MDLYSLWFPDGWTAGTVLLLINLFAIPFPCSLLKKGTHLGSPHRAWSWDGGRARRQVRRSRHSTFLASSPSPHPSPPPPPPSWCRWRRASGAGSWCPASPARSSRSWRQFARIFCSGCGERPSPWGSFSRRFARHDIPYTNIEILRYRRRSPCTKSSSGADPYITTNVSGLGSSSGSCYFNQLLQDGNQKVIFLKFFWIITIWSYIYIIFQS